MNLRINAYIRPACMVRPTGVGKHQINMINALSKMPGISLSIIAPRDTDKALLKHYHPGIPYTLLPFSRRITEFLCTHTELRIFDKYISGDSPWLYFPFEMSTKSHNARIISTFHCVNWFEKDLPWYDDTATARARAALKPVFDKCIKRSSVILSVTEFLKNRISAIFGTEQQRISVVGNGAEKEYFINSEDAGTKVRTDRRIMVLAPLTLRKGGDYLAGVARRLSEKLPYARIIVPGGSPGDPDVETAARACPNIEIRPYIDSRNLADELKNASALLILSRYDTFGIPAIEAMAAGVPVIAANLAGLPEVIGDAGYLVDPADADNVCNLLVKVICDRRINSELINKGLARARQFTWEACAQRLITAVRRVQ